MKTCTAENCSRPIFGGLFCKYHQWQRRLRGGDLYKPKPRTPKPPIPKESKQRIEEYKTYKQTTQEMWDEAVATKTNKCFFCDEVMAHRENLHHLKGRNGSLYIDREWLVLAHQFCHVDQYHRMTSEQLQNLSWYSGFLQRLRAKSEELYSKEVGKGDKTQPLTLF